MSILILLLIAFSAFVFYRYSKYKKQREIEEMAADAQAYVSAELVELLQRYKTITQQTSHDQLSVEHEQAYDKIKQLTEDLLCHTDSEASVREYLSYAKQEIILIQLALDKLVPTLSTQQEQLFEDLK